MEQVDARVLKTRSFASVSSSLTARTRVEMRLKISSQALEQGKSGRVLTITGVVREEWKLQEKKNDFRVENKHFLIFRTASNQNLFSANSNLIFSRLRVNIMNNPKQIITIHNIWVEDKETNSVSEIFAALIKKIPTERKKLEIFEAVSFLKCLEIWNKGELLFQSVNEEKSPYKGIDFFVASKSNEDVVHAFQLVEYKSRYDPIKNTKDFAEWVIKKKFKKGDKKIHLVINVAVEKDTTLNIPLLRSMFKGSPFRSIILFFQIKTNAGNNQYALIFINGFNAGAIVNLREESISKSTDDCPLFS